MKELTAGQLINLAKKTDKVDLKILGISIHIKRMGYLDGLAYYNDDQSNDNLFYLTICDSKGTQLFKSKEECSKFANALTVNDFGTLSNSIQLFNFPSIEKVSKN